MARSPVTYLIMIVVVIIAIFAINYIINTMLIKHANGTTTVSGGGSGSGGSTTVSGTTNSSGSTTVNSTTTVANYSGSCLSGYSTVAIYNGNFSTGTWAGWNVTGNGFGSKPFNVIFANSNQVYYGAPWKGYNGDFFATTYTGGTFTSVGNITSDSFQVTEPYINFKIVSAQSGYLYVELMVKGKPFLIDHYNTYAAQGVTNPQTTFLNASMPVVTLLCQNVSIRVVSQVVEGQSTPYTYIAAGDFYQGKTQVQTPGILVNRTIV